TCVSGWGYMFNRGMDCWIHPLTQVVLTSLPRSCLGLAGHPATLSVFINQRIPINQAMNTETPFEKFLNQHDEEAWSATLATLLRSFHEVDRNAVQIWFAFYPLSLFRALEQSDDRDKLAQQLLLQGDYDLKDQVDRSHRFL